MEVDGVLGLEDGLSGDVPIPLGTKYSREGILSRFDVRRDTEFDGAGFGVPVRDGMMDWNDAVEARDKLPGVGM